MAFGDKTTPDLVNGVLDRVAEVQGVNVQLFSQSAIVRFLQDTFDDLFERYHWKHFVHRETMPLDGVTGEVTTVLTAKILQASDVIAVFPEDRGIPLREPPPLFNPDLITGTFPLHIDFSGDATKPFRVLPVTATGNLFVIYKTRPAALDITDAATIVPFDSAILELGAAIRYGTNESFDPTARQELSGQFAGRLRSLTKYFHQSGIPLNPSSHAEYPVDWFELS